MFASPRSAIPIHSVCFRRQAPTHFAASWNEIVMSDPLEISRLLAASEQFLKDGLGRCPTVERCRQRGNFGVTRNGGGKSLAMSPEASAISTADTDGSAVGRVFWDAKTRAPGQSV